MPRKKVSYADKFIFSIEGKPDATEQEIEDLITRNFLRALNMSGKLGETEITHYKGVKL